ncbi:MAG TPA: response regulator [Anaeromyxobacteraceae bacterium]|nr:response regulator [Anaeromyxobacteraceae bacterium]
MTARVLVVEDDPDIREALEEALASEGYEVALATDGAHALRVAHETLPDLILLDLMMPVMNGWAFRAAQRADPALAGIPVIVVSAVDSDRIAEVEADGYVCKPFTLQELFAEVAGLAAHERAWRRGVDHDAGAAGSSDR